MLTVAWLQWWWRINEVLGTGRPELERRLRQVVSCFSGDEMTN